MMTPSLKVTAAAVLLLGAIACKKESMLPNGQGAMGTQKFVNANNSGTSSVTLFAGQNINVGNVSFNDIDTNGDGTLDALEVVYNTTAPWELVDIHLWVGQGMPPMNNGGNPVVGHYPYKQSGINANTFSVVVPFTSFGYECGDDSNYKVSAHAVVRNTTTNQTQTGWADGARLNAKGNWAMAVTINITCDESQPPPSAETETAWAVFNNSGLVGSNSICFSTIASLNTNKWGWTNGSLSVGNTYEMDLWAAAGQCNLLNGEYVGNVSVNYSGGNAVVTVTTSGTNIDTGAPYMLEEVHLYVGNAQLPSHNGSLTAAPGQFPIKPIITSSNTWMYTVTGLSGDIHVAFHAVVSGFPQGL